MQYFSQIDVYEIILKNLIHQKYLIKLFVYLICRDDKK